MPRVYQHKARKDYPTHGIKKGDTYYEWKNRVGRTSIPRKSLTRPTRAQLTMSSFLGTVYTIFDDDIGGATCPEEPASDEPDEGLTEETLVRDRAADVEEPDWG